MTPSLTYLAWTLVLAVVQIIVAALAKRRQEPPLWAAGARDGGEPTYTGLAARLVRAQRNLFETLPLFIGGVLIAHAAGRDDATVWGCALYFWGRLVFVPVYAAGLPYVRTLVWIVSVIGLALVLGACLLPR